MKNINEIVGINIDIIRHHIPYRKFSDVIFQKTGVKIGAATLQQYVNAVREPKNDKLAIIAKYADKPISWFYQEHSADSDEESSVASTEANVHSFYHLSQDNLSKEINELGAEYLALAKEIKDAKILPEDIKKIIATLQTLKRTEDSNT